MLEKYRRERGVAQNDLRNLLKDRGFVVASGLISKYENGERSPKAEFIYASAKALDLTQEQADALVEAHCADYHLEFLKEYAESMKRDAKEREEK